MTEKKFRLVTRSDFDGLVCGVLLKHLDMIDDIKFVHPKDVQDGKVEICNRDITTNVPYVPDAHLSFDHHASELIRFPEKQVNFVIDAEAPSAARVVFDYYGGFDSFPQEWNGMMEAVDKADAAQYNHKEVLEPRNWELLNFLMDPRTGLGRFRDFTISNYKLMMDLITYCREQDIEDIIKMPDVKERVDLYFEHEEKFKAQLLRCSTVHDNLVVLDLRDEPIIYAGNRFMIYALHPECDISIHVLWGLNQLNTVYATGKSIFDRSCQTNVGELMLRYGGGGHHAAGTCQVSNDEAEATLDELIEVINHEHVLKAVNG